MSICMLIVCLHQQSPCRRRRWHQPQFLRQSGPCRAGSQIKRRGHVGLQCDGCRQASAIFINDDSHLISWPFLKVSASKLNRRGRPNHTSSPISSNHRPGPTRKKVQSDHPKSIQRLLSGHWKRYLKKNFAVQPPEKRLSDEPKPNCLRSVRGLVVR